MIGFVLLRSDAMTRLLVSDERMRQNRLTCADIDTLKRALFHESKISKENQEIQDILKKSLLELDEVRD